MEKYKILGYTKQNGIQDPADSSGGIIEKESFVMNPVNAAKILHKDNPDNILLERQDLRLKLIDLVTEQAKDLAENIRTNRLVSIRDLNIDETITELSKLVNSQID